MLRIVENQSSYWTSLKWMWRLSQNNVKSTVKHNWNYEVFLSIIYIISRYIKSFLKFSINKDTLTFHYANIKNINSLGNQIYYKAEEC